MAISVVNGNGAASTNLTDVTSLVITKPTGTASGDFLIAIVTAHSTANITASGWTQVTSATAGTSLKSWFLTKTAGGSEPASYTFSWSGGASATGGIIAYRGSNGLSGVGLGTMPQSTVTTTTDPTTEPGVYSMTQPYSSGYCLVWHDTRAGGSPAVTCTGSTGTERWDNSTIDGSPSTHERGSAAYTKTGIGAEGSDSSGATCNPTQTIDAGITWSWAVAEQPYATGSATHSGATAAGTGTVTSNPTGSGALLHSGATADGTAYEWPTIDGAALHSGATASGEAYEHPTILGAVLHSGATAAATGYEWPTIDGACLHSGAIASGEVVVSGTKLEIKVDGVWTDITSAIRHNTGVTITRGRSSSAQSMTTTRCSFTLDNRDHAFSPFNPNGAYYGYLGRNTEIRVIKQETGVRFHGELSSYTFGTDRSGNDLVVDIECAGLLRRLEQGETPTASPMRRAILQAAADGLLAQYWPCEDEEGARSLAPVDSTPLVGWDPPLPAVPLTISAPAAENATVTSSFEGFKASAGIPQIGNSTWTAPGGAWGIDSTMGLVSFLLASPGGMTDETYIMVLDENEEITANTMRISLRYSATNELTLAVADGVGLDEDAGTVNLVGRTDGVLVYVGWENKKYDLWIQYPGDSEPTLAASVDTSGAGGPPWGGAKPMTLRINHLKATLNEASSVYLGHLATWKTYDSGTPVLPDLTSALDAHLGEPAGVRFQRLCEEEGITFEGQGTMANSSAMGYQTTKAFTELLRECEETDLGLMYEIRDDLGLGYIVRSHLYNRSTTATFDYQGNHLLEELKPIYDDKDIRNKITVTREGGSSATYEKTTGPMSTSPAPSGVGRYDDGVTVSLESDEDCYAQAGWRVHLGTVDEIRVQSIATGLEVPEIDADNALTLALLALDVGHRVVVENTPGWMPVDEVDQVVQGYTERWDPTEHRFSFNADPFSPYRIATVAAVVSTTTQAKIGVEEGASVTNEALDTTETVIDVAAPDSTLNMWTTSGVDFDVIIGGERMTVTAVANTGGGSQQLTVTRSVNGVVKSHPTGETIRLYRPAVIGL